MLEIKERHWLAKAAAWHFGGATMALPNVAAHADKLVAASPTAANRTSNHPRNDRTDTAAAS